MATLAQLQRERARLMKLKQAEMIRQRKIDEKAQLKREIFNLKYGSKIDKVKKVGNKLRGFAEKYRRNQTGKTRRTKRSSGNFGYSQGSIF
jgi:vacuolar-type H+-ATPase subunit E/Vma4